jgi:hypothetical protein
MTVGLGIAGVGWFALGIGHTAIGLRRVLPRLATERIPRSAFGMLRFTWYVVSVQLFANAVLFSMLAWAPGLDAQTLVLRWFATVSLVLAATAGWSARRRLRTLLRPPVAPALALIAVLCWAAST